MIENSTQFRIELSMHPEAMASMSQAITGPCVGGDLNIVMLRMFSDYFRYLFLVWGDPAMESSHAFSWRKKEQKIPKKFVDAAVRDADMLMTTAIAYKQHHVDFEALEPASRLVINLHLFLGNVVELCDELLSEFEFPKEHTKSLKQIRDQAHILVRDVAVYAYGPFETHLGEFCI